MRTVKRRCRASKWRHKLNYLPTRADLSAEVCTNLRDDCWENGIVAAVDMNVGTASGIFFPKSYDEFTTTQSEAYICEKFSDFLDL